MVVPHWPGGRETKAGSRCAGPVIEKKYSVKKYSDRNCSDMTAQDNPASHPIPRPAMHKTHRSEQRPPFERIALVLQGGGALGAYQAGVYQALAEANLHPDWVAGISIGAINSALIAGNPPEKRVERLREFWETVSTAPLDIPSCPRSRSRTNSLTTGSISCAR